MDHYRNPVQQWTYPQSSYPYLGPSYLPTYPGIPEGWTVFYSYPGMPTTYVTRHRTEPWMQNYYHPGSFVQHHPGPSQQRTQTPGPNQQRTQHLGPRQQRTYQPGPNQQRTHTPGPNQLRAQQPGPSQRRPQQPGPHYPGPNHLGSLMIYQPGPSQPGPNHPRPSMIYQPGPNQQGPSNPGPLMTYQPGPQQPGPQHPVPLMIYQSGSSQSGPDQSGRQQPGHHPGPSMIYQPGPNHPGPSMIYQPGPNQQGPNSPGPLMTYQQGPHQQAPHHSGPNHPGPSMIYQPVPNQQEPNNPVPLMIHQPAHSQPEPDQQIPNNPGPLMIYQSGRQQPGPQHSRPNHPGPSMMYQLGPDQQGPNNSGPLLIYQSGPQQPVPHQPGPHQPGSLQVVPYINYQPRHPEPQQPRPRVEQPPPPLPTPGPYQPRRRKRALSGNANVEDGAEGQFENVQQPKKNRVEAAVGLPNNCDATSNGAEQITSRPSTSAPPQGDQATPQGPSLVPNTVFRYAGYQPGNLFQADALNAPSTSSGNMPLLIHFIDLTSDAVENSPARIIEIESDDEEVEVNAPVQVKQECTSDDEVITHNLVNVIEVKTELEVNQEPMQRSSDVIDSANSKVYDQVALFIPNLEALKKHGYPVESPTNPNVTIVHNPNAGKIIHNIRETRWCEKICARCEKSFYINKSNFSYYTKESCRYHWAKLRSESYECCGGLAQSKGCTQSQQHVWSGLNAGENELRGFTKLEGTPKLSIVALDCEMVYTLSGMEVASVALLDIFGCLIFKTLVQTQYEIVDFNSRFSGITQEKYLTEKKITFKHLRKVLNNHMNSQTIIVGHGLENDLRVLKIIHHLVVDSAILYPHPKGFPVRRSLKNLAWEVLGRRIQESGQGHDPAEDAKAALALVIEKVHNYLLRKVEK